MIEPEPWLTIEDVAKTMKVRRQTIERMIQRGDLPASHFGRRVRINPADLRTYLEKTQIKPNSASTPLEDL